MPTAKLYHPDSATPFALSRFKVELFMDCPRCFYLDTDAQQRRAVNLFTDIVAWKLATVAYHFGPWAAGDIMRKLGAHLVTIAQAEVAQREAKQAEKAGLRPN